MAIDTDSTTSSILNSLIEIRDLLKISKERGDAELHWLQLHRLFEESKEQIFIAVKKSSIPKWGAGVDFVLPLGNACRPARQLKSAGLRTFSSPLDWMMKYPLDLAADLIIKAFKGFFADPWEDEIRGKNKNNRYVIDRSTGMISMHGFSHAKSMEEELPVFHEKMIRRGKRLKEKILAAERIGVLMNRNEPDDVIIAFAEKMSAAFPNQRFYILNVWDDNTFSRNAKSRRLIRETEAYSICESRFKDEHELGTDPKTNPSFWLGNGDAWQKLIKEEFSLRENEYPVKISNEFRTILGEIDSHIDTKLARRYKPETPYYSADAEFVHPEVKVSVIIPVYNVEKYLRECLDSVVNQTLKEIEIICVDDGSTDSTPQILEEYVARDSRIKILRQQNQFAGVARNNGMKIAQGKYLCFLDSDDVFDLKMLKKAFEHAEKHSAEVVLWGAKLFSERISDAKDAPGILDFEKIPSSPVFSIKEIPEHAFSFCWGCPWNKLFSREFVERQNLYWSDTRVSNDIFFVFSAFLSAERISYLRDAFVFHRWRYSNNSIQGSFNLAPLDFIKASKSIYDFINAKGLKDLFGESCARSLIGNATGYVNRATEENKKIILRTLRDGGFSSFGVSSKNVWNFESWKVRFFISATHVDTPAISVIIPVYNTEKFLRKCLDSIIEQTLQEIEIICINDGSTDNSLSILKEYAQLDSRVVIITQENKGAATARNVGLSKARGDFVCFMDPDDWYPAKDVLEALYVSAKRENVEICGGSLEEHKPDGTITRNYKPEDLKWGETFYENKRVSTIDYPYDWGYQRFVFSRKLLTGNNIVFPCYARYEDPPFFIKALFTAGQFYALKKITYAYRVSYKPVDYYKDPKKCEDIFRGVRDCIVLAKRHSAYKLAERFFRFWTNRWLVSQWIPTFNAYSQVQESILSAWDELPQKPISAVADEWKKNYTQRKYSSPLVSVIIPVYNVETYLRECMDSVCSQNLREIEIICVNDGSTDGSLAILEEYAAKDSRVKVITQANTGLGAARNVGLSRASGEFVYFMDSDDVSPQGALSKMYSELKRDGLDVLFFSAISFYETPELEQSHAHYKTYYTRKEFDVIDGQRLGVKFQNTRSNFASACCYCCRRDFLLETGIRFPENCLYEDNAAFWSILKSAQRAKSISEPLFQRRVRQGSIMTKRKLDFRNFAGYAKTVFIFDKIAHSEKALIPEFEAVLKGNVNYFSQTLIHFYQQVSPEDRARSRELLCNELRDSAWLNPVRENIAKIEGIDLLMAEDSTASAKRILPQVFRENPSSSAGASIPESSKKLPRLLVRLGAMFILNKAARKRFRERHMDLTPKDGVDINAYPEMHRDSALKRFSVRIASLFIFNKQARRAFREKHLNLTPKDGVDVRALSPEERRLRKQKKRERNVFRRLFNAVIPASRAKIAHTEKHLFLHTEQQTARILAEIRASRAQSERLFNGIKMELVRIREQNERTMRELGSAQKDALTQIRTELASKIEALDSRVEACIKSGREIFQQQNARDEDLVKTFDEVKSQVSGAVERYSGLEEILRESFLKRLENSGVVPNSLEFRTFGDLAHCIRKNLHKIPSDIDLVVGNPRSGIVPAYMIALFMNRRCCSLDEFLFGATGSVGIRPVEKRETRKVLIVDDSCYNGTAMEKVREKLKSCDGKYEFIYMAVYGRKDSADKLDFYLEPVEGRRVWQWNCLNHSLAGAACFDMDGVLCVDPTLEENDDGEKYIHFIKTAKPLYIPTYEIHTIVTSRLEKYRAITEEWLRANNVRYKELVMLDLPSAEERRRLKCHAPFKADEYKKRKDTNLFVESEDWQAKEIAFLTGKQVLCVQTDKIY